MESATARWIEWAGDLAGDGAAFLGLERVADRLDVQRADQDAAEAVERMKRLFNAEQRSAT